MIATTTRIGATHGIAVALLVAALHAQSPGPDPTPVPAGGGGSQPGASATALPAPGELPAGASEQARTAWKALVQAASGEASGRIQAFDLVFEGRVYSGEKQTNDLDARYLYLEPGFVRTVFESGRERLRGPDGDFLVERGKAISLKGKDFEVDRRELDETVSVSRIFVGLTDPRQLRLVALEALAAAPVGLPASLVERAAKLLWIAVESPDFRGQDADQPARLDRVEIGLERATHLPVLALVTDRAQPQAGVLVQLDKYVPLDGYRVPGDVTTWRVAPQAAGTRPLLRPGERLPFETKPALRLWLKEGRLRPRLERKDFLPPAS